VELDVREGRIDVHQHVIPPVFRDKIAHHEFDPSWLARCGWESASLLVPPWSPESALAMMDLHRVDAAIMAVSVPGVHLGDDREARVLARAVNEWTAELVKDRPDRFGLFAALPLPDLDGALTEAAHALDELNADGVLLMSSSGGVYLGDDGLTELMAYLDERGAVAFVHPSFLPARAVPGMQQGITDLPLETTRAAVKLVASGQLRRFPRLRIILPHAGGYLPYGSHRFAHLSPVVGGGPQTPDEFLSDLRRFYFDTALAASPTVFPSLLALADPDRILFGSDYPYAPPAAVRSFTDGLDEYPALRDSERAAIDRGNAERLFPRLAGRAQARPAEQDAA
jgi:6-methylsalicylate decarboxylase